MAQKQFFVLTSELCSYSALFSNPLVCAHDIPHKPVYGAWKYWGNHPIVYSYMALMNSDNKDTVIK